MNKGAEQGEAYVMTDERVYRRVAELAGAIHSSVLAGFHLKTSWLWAEKLPKVLDVRRQLGVPD